MSNDDRTVYRFTKEAMRKLVEAGEFGSVGHARHFIAEDETVSCPNTLTFFYEKTQFFLDVTISGTARLRRAGEAYEGIGDAIDVQDAGFCRKVCDLLRTQTDPVVQVNDIGEAVVIRGKPSDGELRRKSFTHAICSGWVDKHVVSDSHFALSCRMCHLRLVIPKSVRTVEDFKAHFAALLR